MRNPFSDGARRGRLAGGVLAFGLMLLLGAAPLALADPITTTLFVPIVLSLPGTGGAAPYASELTLTNKGPSAASIAMDYTAIDGGGSGRVMASLPPGEQLLVFDTIGWLRYLGLPIAPSGLVRGTLRLTFSGLSAAADAMAYTRMTAPALFGGLIGFGQPAVPPERLLGGNTVVCGLRQDTAAWSNLYLQNAGGPSDGSLTLHVSVFSGNTSLGTAVGGFDVVLAPGGFSATSSILQTYGVSNGFVRVSRVAGTAPFWAFATTNEPYSADSAYVAPALETSLGGAGSITLPLVVETSSSSTEVVLTNLGLARTVRTTLTSPALTSGSVTYDFPMAAGEQLILTNFVQVLRDRGVTGIPTLGTAISGPLTVGVPGQASTSLYVGARVLNAATNGFCAFSLPGVPAEAASTGPAWLHGLEQTSETRTSLAIVNTGEPGTAADTFTVDVFNGDTGGLAGAGSFTVPARGSVQVDAVLTALAPGTQQGYLRVTRTAGDRPFLAYALITDGASAGQRSGDSSYVQGVPFPGPAVPTRFYPLTPCRIADTRNLPSGPTAGPALQPNGALRVFPTAGLCGVATTAVSLVANVTITQAGSDGDLTLYPGDEAPAVTTAIAFKAGQTRANNARLKLSGDGLGGVGTRNNSTAPVHFILDVSGYFAP